jgi:hypothetical protein
MLTNTARRRLVTGALALGAAAGAAGVANAASGGSQSGGTAASPPAFVAGSANHHGTPPGDPARMSHGPGETLLTGSAAARAKAAALKAVPGATVIRVESDSGPAAYEAHLRKTDGSYVTVNLDTGFHVVATQSGFGAGGPPPQGAPPAPGSA